MYSKYDLYLCEYKNNENLRLFLAITMFFQGNDLSSWFFFTP